METWEGHKLTKEEAREAFGHRAGGMAFGIPADFSPAHVRVRARLSQFQRAQARARWWSRRATRGSCGTRRRAYPLHEYQRLARLMHRLRAVKNPAEVALMQRGVRDHRGGLSPRVPVCQAGRDGMEVEAEFAHEFIRRGGQFAYEPIIAAGTNACVLHYLQNDQPCREGELLLLDVAASYANYNSDLTRTIPVGGKFHPAAKAGLQCRPARVARREQGRDARQTAAGLAEGSGGFIEKELVELGLLKMSDIKKQDPENPAFKKYFMHGVGHPLGLDVHDVTHTVKPIQAGWVLTVEPGIYIREEEFAVRLENDILVGESGNVDLMASIPIEAGDIEELMNRGGETQKAQTRGAQPMSTPFWQGVFPAITTQLKRDQSLDLEATARHANILIDSGVAGLIFLGSLGENGGKDSKKEDKPKSEGSANEGSAESSSEERSDRESSSKESTRVKFVP